MKSESPLKHWTPSSLKLGNQGGIMSSKRYPEEFNIEAVKQITKPYGQNRAVGIIHISQ